MTVEEIYAIYRQYPQVTTDSRQCPQGSMFFALRGANFDGNAYAAAALAQGCAVAVIDSPTYAVEGDSRYILVDDVLQTLQDLAAYHREQLQIPVIQVTGTNGKTTTKELISAVLSRKYKTLYTQGNLNNHIGVPLTLLRISPEHEIAVIETGANHPGEIKQLSGMVKADCGLITNVGRAHLEGFGSFEGVKATKGELYDDLQSRGKFTFINMMDWDLVEMAMDRGLQMIPYVQGVVEQDLTEPQPQPSALQTWAMGGAAAEPQPEEPQFNPFLKLRWLTHGGTACQVQTHLIGDYNLPNVLSAITIGLHYGVAIDDINAALRDYTPTNNRSQYLTTPNNQLIIDAYNANASSMAVALDNFKQIRHTSKMVILGDMREMGQESTAEHQKVVDRLSKMRLDEVWLVGSEFAKCRTKSLKNYTHFDDVEEVKSRLTSTPVRDRLILIKGSNGTRLYQLPSCL